MHTHLSIKDEEIILVPEAGHLPTLTLHKEPNTQWIEDHNEGRLAVDVFETKREIVVQTPIAGISSKDLDLFVNGDMLTVRGTRQPNRPDEINRHLVNECHWGSFSRSIILPSEVNAGEVNANLKDGVLTIRLPKILRSKKITVKNE